MSTPNQDNFAHGPSRGFRKYILLGLGSSTVAILAFMLVIFEIKTVANSADGKTLAISVAGDISIFRLNEKGEGVQLGQNLVGDFAGDSFGFSLSLSEDGTILAVGAPGFGNNRQGYVTVYYLEYDNLGVRWKQLGQVIKDKRWVRDGFGYSVALSGNGKAIAIGENYHLSGNNVRVYHMDDAGLVWTQLGEDSGGDNSGYSASLPAIVQDVGSFRTNENVTNSAHAKDDYAYVNLLNVQ